MFPVAWFFLLHLHKICCSKNPLPDFFQTVFTKKAPSVVWLLMQKQWSSGRTQRPKLFPGPVEKGFLAPREKDTVARAPTSATVTNSLQSLQGRNTRKKRGKHLPHKQCRIPKLGKQASARTHQSPLTEYLSKRRHPTKLGAKPKNRPELRRVSAKGNCGGSAIADIYISH